MRPGKLVLVIAGSLIAALGGAFALGGGALLVAHTTQRDATGFYATSTERFVTPNYALTSNVDLGQNPGEHDWAPFEHLATVRLRAEHAGEGAVFIGIAPRSAVDRYLSGVAHDEVVDVRIAPFQAHYRAARGGAPPAPPQSQRFWVAQASGSGRQTVTWKTESGQWAVVVMNANASPGVRVDASVGAKVGFVLPLGIGLAVGGIALVAAGVVMILFGARRELSAEPHAAETAPSPPRPTGVYPVQVDARLDAPLSRWLWLVKWVLVIPHAVVLAGLWIAFVVMTFVAGVAILFTGRYPRSIFDFNVGVLRWTWRVAFYCYSALGTDRYPPFSLHPVAGYPADLSVDYPEQLSRGLVLVKWWLLALPQYLVLAIIAGGVHLGASSGLIGLLVLVAAVVLLFTGRYPDDIFTLVVGLNRWAFRVVAYAALMRDEYPPFRLDQGGADPASVPSTSPPAPVDGGVLVGAGMRD